MAGTAPMIVVATPAGERHEVGAMLAAGAAAIEGWRVMYLGADLPAEDIVRAALDADTRMVALSTVYPADSRAVSTELQAIRAGLPADVAVLVGGAGVRRLNGAAALAGVTLVSDLAELRRRLSSA